MNFGEIFAQFYAQYRGQGTNIPAFGTPEYKTAIYIANAAVQVWDRLDGTLWRELIVTAGSQTTDVWPTLNRSIVDGTLSYTAPTNMRKTPSFVRFGDGSTGYSDIPVVPPQEAMSYSDTSSIVWFEGGANKGYTMHIGSSLSTQYAGRTVDYVYYKKPTLFTIATTPAAIVPDMSDPNFLVSEMLRRRFMNSRNGFGFRVADADAKASLINMKIENESGVWGNSDRERDLLANQGWGVNSPVGDIKL